MRKDLELMSRVLEWVDKNAEHYFNHLIGPFARVIFLRVVDYIIEHLYLQLFKEWSPKFIKKLQILVSYQLIKNTLINTIKSDEKFVGLLLGDNAIFLFDRGDPLKELARH